MCKLELSNLTENVERVKVFDYDEYYQRGLNAIVIFFTSYAIVVMLGVSTYWIGYILWVKVSLALHGQGLHLRDDDVSTSSESSYGPPSPLPSGIMHLPPTEPVPIHLEPGQWLQIHAPPRAPVLMYQPPCEEVLIHPPPQEQPSVHPSPQEQPSVHLPPQEQALTHQPPREWAVLPPPLERRTSEGQLPVQVPRELERVQSDPIIAAEPTSAESTTRRRKTKRQAAASEPTSPTRNVPEQGFSSSSSGTYRTASDSSFPRAQD